MTNNETRLHHLDAMRSVLMMLGIVLHTAQIYNPEKIWRIWSDDSSIVSLYLVEIIGSFRMPAFFVVSGFFCLMTLQKYGSSQFARVRIKRIAIPLLVAGLCLNSLQTTVLHFTGWAPFDASDYFGKAGWVVHLWFLVVLLVYFSFAALIYAFLRKPMSVIGNSTANILAKTPMLVLLFLAPTVTVAIFILASIGYPLYAEIGFGIIFLYPISLFLPFFLFGTLLLSNKALLLRFSTISYWVLIVLIASAMLITHFAEATLQGVIQRVSAEYLGALMSWALVALVFRVFRDFFSSKSALWTFYSDASYTVYLFHHFMVILLGLLAIQLNLPPLVGMVAVISMTLLVTTLIHKYLITPYKPMRFLFNGK